MLPTSPIFCPCFTERFFFEILINVDYMVSVLVVPLRTVSTKLGLKLDEELLYDSIRCRFAGTFRFPMYCIHAFAVCVPFLIQCCTVRVQCNAGLLQTFKDIDLSIVQNGGKFFSM